MPLNCFAVFTRAQSFSHGHTPPSECPRACPNATVHRGRRTLTVRGAAGQGFGRPRSGVGQAGARSDQPKQSPQPSVEKNDVTNVEAGRMVLAFTCNQCNTRVAKKITKKAYTTGVVIVECPGCHSRHLIADHLGWYKDWTDGGKMKTVEDFAHRDGQVVHKVSPEDIAID